MTASRAGFFYYAILFALGFLLGGVRTLFVAPAVGEIAAVALEIPVMLMASWFVSLRIIEKSQVPETGLARLVMGGVAFTALIVSEHLLATVGFSQTVAEQLAAYGTAAGQLGLAAQLVFAAIPFLQLRVS